MFLARQGKGDLFLPQQQKKDFPDTKKLLRREVPMIWLRGKDLNLRPSGYEPDELPSCSIPRQYYSSLRRMWDSNPRTLLHA